MAGLHGYGAQLYYDTNTDMATAVASGTAIANIISISGPDQTRDSIDISTMDSSAKFREFIPAMADAGEVTIELNYVAAQAATLDTYLKNSSTSQYWMIRFNDHTTEESKSQWISQGYMTALGHAIPFDDKITQSATFKFSGVPTAAAS